MTDGQDRALGRIEGQLSTVMRDIAEGAESRRRLHEKLDGFGRDIGEIKRDVKDLDGRVALLEPDVLDYRTKRQQVEGAGKLGKFLWWLGGVILAGATALIGWLIWFGWMKPHP